jgi:hypothetical protein
MVKYLIVQFSARIHYRYINILKEECSIKENLNNTFGALLIFNGVYIINLSTTNGKKEAKPKFTIFNCTKD